MDHRSRPGERQRASNVEAPAVTPPLAGRASLPVPKADKSRFLSSDQAGWAGPTATPPHSTTTMEPEAALGEVLSGMGAMNDNRTRRRHSRGGFCLDNEKTAGSRITALQSTTSRSITQIL